MQAMTRSVPPHTPQCSMSMWKTRLRRLHPAHWVEEAHGVRGRLDEHGWGRCGGGV